MNPRTRYRFALLALLIFQGCALSHVHYRAALFPKVVTPAMDATVERRQDFFERYKITLSEDEKTFSANSLTQPVQSLGSYIESFDDSKLLGTARAARFHWIPTALGGLLSAAGTAGMIVIGPYVQNFNPMQGGSEFGNVPALLFYASALVAGAGLTIPLSGFPLSPDHISDGFNYRLKKILKLPAPQKPERPWP